MIRYDRKTRLLAAGLSALAGYVDAIGFLGTGGFFVSFMSGNSTRLGVGLAQSVDFALTALALVGAFVAGVVAGGLIGGAAGMHRQSAILAVVAGALILAASIAPFALPLITFAIVAFAMGAENMYFEADGEIRIGLTYMTGTLVKIGQRLASAMTGGERWGWVPFLLLWLGLIVGAVMGAFAYARLGLDAIWIAAGVASILAVVVGLAPLRKAPARA